ncbi:hypothetical protein AAG747_07870 [Rapidithrix thailandica]|uniref:Uncharacterized protein n=1 Tax=Rapidithrix thailandica TaxID=413964 RepID=A0AAW9SAS5_9BACT
MSLRQLVPTLENPYEDGPVELDCAGFEVLNRGACMVRMSFSGGSAPGLELAPGEQYRSPVLENLRLQGPLWLRFEEGGSRNVTVIKYTEHNQESFA